MGLFQQHQITPMPFVIWGTSPTMSSLWGALSGLSIRHMARPESEHPAPQHPGPITQLSAPAFLPEGDGCFLQLPLYHRMSPFPHSAFERQVTGPRGCTPGRRYLGRTWGGSGFPADSKCWALAAEGQKGGWI